MPAFVQSASNSGTGSTLTITLGTATTGGNTLVVMAAVFGATTSGTVSGITIGGVADNFASAVTSGVAANFATAAGWTDPGCIGGQTSVVVTITGGTGTQTIMAYAMEFSGVFTANPVDQVVSGFLGSATSSWNSNITPNFTQAGDVAVGLVAGQAASEAISVTTATPWINLTQVTATNNCILSSYSFALPNTTPGLSYAGTFSVNSPYNAIVLSLTPVPTVPFLVQSVRGSFNTATGSLSLPFATTPGNCLIVAYGSNGTVSSPALSGVTIGGVADNFAQVVNITQTDNASIWADQSCIGGQTAVAYTTTGGSGSLTVVVTVMEWSGVFLTGAADQTSTGFSNSAISPWSSGATSATTYASELVIGSSFFTGTGALLPTGPGTGWSTFKITSLPNNFAALQGWNVVTAKGAQTFNGTATGTGAAYAACVATFKVFGPNLVQSVTNTSSGSSTLTLTLPSPTTAGNCVIVAVAASGTTNPSVSTITLGGVAGFSAAVTQNGTAAFNASIWQNPACAGGQTSVVVTVTGGSGTLHIDAEAMEWSGLDPNSLTINDHTISGVNNSTVTPFTTGATSLTSMPVEVAVAIVTTSLSTTISPPVSPWVTTAVVANQVDVSYRVLAAAQTVTYNGAFAPVAAYTAAVATFRSAFLPPTVLGSWTGSYSRSPNAYAAGPPSLTPLAIPVTPVSGNWMFALVSWRQDAGVAGVLRYPSTVTVSDDAGNFWIPAVTSLPSLPATASGSTGIVRSAIWFAPAARASEFVFFSPTGYQSAITALVVELQADCPWYSIQAQTASFVNQGSSVSQSLVIPANTLALGILSWDSYANSVTTSAPGWTAPFTTVTAAGNGLDHFGDLQQDSWYGTGTGAALSLSATTSGTMDFATVLVTIHGVTDAIPFPYTQALENWPVLVTEIGAGALLNKDPVIAQGTTFWSGQNATVAAVTQPLWEPQQPYQPQQFGSLLVTPTGSAGQGTAASEQEPVSVTTQYAALAYVYSPAGFGSAAQGSGVYVGLNFFGPGGYIETLNCPPVQLEPGQWTLIEFGPRFPPPGTTQASLVCTETTNGGGNISPNAPFVIGYAAFGPADAYEFAAPDEVAWTDISSRVFTQGSMQLSRGIQYEQQSLEAGTLTVYADNHDGFFTFGNVLSPYWPNVGDTDVPLRLRAIYPGSLTPYVMLFSGFTDQITYGVDESTYYGFAEIQASDAWSRLTQQMLALTAQEALLDNPVVFIPCSNTGANIVSGNIYSSTPAVSQFFITGGAALASVTPPTASFTSGAISLPGASGQQCWSVTGTGAANQLGAIGYVLAWFPPTPLNVTAGVTVEFWYSPVSNMATQPALGGSVPIIYAVTSANEPMWELYLNSGPTPDISTLSFMHFVTGTFGGAGTTVGTTIPFLQSSFATQSYYISVTFNQQNATIVVNPGSSPTQSVSVSYSAIPAECAGFFWAGSPFRHGSDGAVADIAIYTYEIPPARSAAHCAAGATAFVSEPDTWRLARVASYSGFIPTLGMRGLDLPAAGSYDVDIVTGATDTNTQVVSAYFSNVAASTLAAMFVDGAGTLNYRRRAEWYNRPVGQFAVGENDQQLLSLGLNPLNTSVSLSGWLAENGATLSTSSQPAAGPVFNPFCAVFTGNGTAFNPQIAFGRAGPGPVPAPPAVTQGNYYTLSCWVYSPQGWTAGMFLQLQWYSGATPLAGTQTYSIPGLAAGQLAYLTVSGRAPATADNAAGLIGANGTPPSTTGFFVAGVLIDQVTVDYTAGQNVAVPEAPYLSGFQTSSDRALLFNYTVLTQYGTNLISSFSGTSVLFTPSSGVIVIISNTASVALRGQIPYTATIYINNTQQALPYYLGEGSMEDFGNWIVNTLGSPLFRPDKVILTPAATPGALITGLTADTGDTVLYRRRPFGSPTVVIQAYASKITHNIDISSGTWTVQLELSPFPQGSILACDDVVHGVLTGQNNFGW